MTSTLFFVIDSDPRSSGRPAEAIRIAAGTAVWKRTGISICLVDAAVLLLGDDAGDLVDGDSYSRHLPIILESGCQLLVNQGNKFLEEAGEISWEHSILTPENLARAAAASDGLCRF